MQVAVGQDMNISLVGVRPGEADHGEAIDRRPLHAHPLTVGSSESVENVLRVTVRERNGIQR